MKHNKIYRELSRSFPISCSSDEFYYFPQVQSTEPDFRVWDHYSPDFITEFARKLVGWEKELELAHPCNQSELIDFRLLQQTLQTLREQLIEVRLWQTQPSMHLMIATIGMTEALWSVNPAAKYERATTLPAFLKGAAHCLDKVPVLFQEIGLKMVSATRAYFVQLERELPVMQTGLRALDQYESDLKKVSITPDFVLPRDLYQRILSTHIRAGSIDQVDEILNVEIADMEAVIREHLDTDPIPLPDSHEDGLIGLYQDEVSHLERHCRKAGLIPVHLRSCPPVRVAAVPDFLKPVRTASSYSIRPGYPSSGGDFFIINAHDPAEIKQPCQREYRLLCAHETYPGHHLLDSARWSLNNSLRRPLEAPLFYEGWACFAETLLTYTGYFNTPAELLMLAKRRLWRALRGKIDLGLQTRRLNFKSAAHLLVKVGINRKQAEAVVRKYPLNPGYQVCYTAGTRQFMELYQRYGNDQGKFARTVLSQGEILLEDLQ